MAKKFDISGWATKADMLCSDGVIIKKDAFKDCDGVTVPLVWNHQHKWFSERCIHSAWNHQCRLSVPRRTDSRQRTWIHQKK